jgi:hypothetical protein
MGKAFVDCLSMPLDNVRPWNFRGAFLWLFLAELQEKIRHEVMNKMQSALKQFMIHLKP